MYYWRVCWCPRPRCLNKQKKKKLIACTSFGKLCVFLLPHNKIWDSSGATKSWSLTFLSESPQLQTGVYRTWGTTSALALNYTEAAGITAG